MMLIKSNKFYFSIGVAGLLFLSIHLLMGNHRSENYLSKVKSGNGTFIQSKTFGDLSFDLTYCSPRLMAIKQSANGEHSSHEFKELKRHYQAYSNYSLKMENLDGKGLLKKMIQNQAGYQELINYLSFGIEEDISLCTSTDTLACSFTHFERNFDLAPYAQIEIGFAKEGIAEKLCKEESWTIQFDAERFGIGMLNFRFVAEDVCQ